MRGYIGAIPKNFDTIPEGTLSLDDHFRWYGPKTGWDRIFQEIASIPVVDTTETITTFGSGTVPSGTYKWWGGALASNDCIYGIPYVYSKIIKIDTSDDSITLFDGGQDLSASAKFSGGVTAPNGCIYGIPSTFNKILKIDPSDDSVTLFDGGQNLSGTKKWSGGLLGPDDCIYGMPRDGTTVLKIDPSNDSVTLMPILTALYFAGTEKFMGCGLSKAGDIIGVNTNFQYTFFINNETGANFFCNFDNANSYRFCGSVLAGNGDNYFIPYSASGVGKLNTNTFKGSRINNDLGDGSYKFCGGILAPNGKIYGIPHSLGYVLRIDPSDDTVDSVGTVYGGSSKYWGGVLAPNGSIYGIPASATDILKISGIGTIGGGKKALLSPYVNKF